MMQRKGRRRHRLSGDRGFLRFAAEAMTLEQSVRRRTIDACETCSARHVAGSPGDEASDVVLLELREHLLLREMVGVVQHNGRGAASYLGTAGLFIVQHNLVRRNA